MSGGSQQSTEVATLWGQVVLGMDFNGMFCRNNLMAFFSHLEYLIKGFRRLETGFPARQAVRIPVFQ